MERYNLLDEKWISVMADYGEKLVSLTELFEQAHELIGLAGDMKMQDFAVMRILLAVLHTVFSRYRPDGTPYEYFEVDSARMQQVTDIDEDDVGDYQNALYETWFDLWNEGRFPDLIGQYLEAWRDRFFLFADNNAFMQVSRDQIDEGARGGSEIWGKNINRLISQSNNKAALFSPKHDINKNRERLSYAALARWMITFHGYCGTGDKHQVYETHLTYSKGWLYDLGGIYLEGANLFETLMINCALAFDEMGNLLHRQVPSWERTSEENIQLYFSAGMNNLASLYTAWGRATYFDPEYQEGTPFSCFVGKLPEINHKNEFLEPMTCWRYNKSGSNKDKFTPCKHEWGQSTWRNFGTVMGIESGESGDKQHKAGVLKWFDEIHTHAISWNGKQEIAREKTKICAISVKEDGNPASWAPVDEIYDEMRFEEMVLLDTEVNGWLVRINRTVEWTKTVTSKVLRPLLRDLAEIRGMDIKKGDPLFVSRETEKFYYQVDTPFRSWLDGISASDSKEEKVQTWKAEFKALMISFVDDLLRSGSSRDYKGIVSGDGDTSARVKNNATIYHSFMRDLNKQFS